MGALYTAVQADDIFPCTTAILWHVQSIVTSEKEALMKEISIIDSIVFFTDLWMTNGNTSDNHITVTAHYLPANLQLNSKILTTQIVNEKQSLIVLGMLQHQSLKSLEQQGKVSTTKAAFRNYA